MSRSLNPNLDLKIETPSVGRRSNSSLHEYHSILSIL